MAPYTAEMIEEVSGKARAQRYWDGYREMHKCAPKDRRHPDTIVGFLSKEKLHEMFSNPDPDQLLFATGLVFFDNEEVAFFSDDSLFGYGLIPTSLGPCSISNIYLRYGEDMEFPDVDAIIDRFFKGKRFLNSIEELVDYLNSK